MTSAASLVSVDKIGADFHRLERCARLKSPCRSVSFMEALLYALALILIEHKAYVLVGDLYWNVVRGALALLPGGDCSTGIEVPQGILRMR